MSLSNNIESKWYALHTKPRFEKKVHEQLNKQGYEVFLPLITTVRQWSDRKKKVQIPLLSSYVFIYCNHLVLNDFYSYPGVLRVVKHLGTPAIIQKFEIENLKILMDNEVDVNYVPLEGLVKGDAIIVEKGPFQNLVAECIELNGKHRVIVKFNGLNSGIELNIPISYVKKVQAV